MRATFSRWPDRLVGAFILAAALAGARSWTTGRHQDAALWAALGASILSGVGAGRALRSRLAYQQHDGLLSADALQSRSRLSYLVAGLGLGLLLVMVAVVIVRPSLLLVSVPGYVGGTLVGVLVRRPWVERLIDNSARVRRTLRVRSRSPVAGFAAAALLMLLLLSVRNVETSKQMMLAGSATALLGLMLGRIDHATVRFMTLAGHGSARIFANHAPSLIIFLIAAVSATSVVVGWRAAAVAGAAASAMLLLFVVRILSYRVLERHGADLLVSILLGLLIFVASSLPPLLPVIVILMLWQMQRHGQKRRWLIR